MHLPCLVTMETTRFKQTLEMVSNNNKTMGSSNSFRLASVIKTSSLATWTVEMLTKTNTEQVLIWAIIIIHSAVLAITLTSPHLNNSSIIMDITTADSITTTTTTVQTWAVGISRTTISNSNSKCHRPQLANLLSKLHSIYLTDLFLTSKGPLFTNITTPHVLYLLISEHFTFTVLIYELINLRIHKPFCFY
jgi:hypothetical protein